MILDRNHQVNVGVAFPRIRGGDPGSERTGQAGTALFPAYAGVIPPHNQQLRLRPSFPRIRGGDPSPLRVAASKGNFSPHTRG